MPLPAVTALLRLLLLLLVVVPSTVVVVRIGKYRRTRNRRGEKDGDEDLTHDSDFLTFPACRDAPLPMSDG
jgi:hypothetical protein